MSPPEKQRIKPRLVIHGGAGNIIRSAENLDDDAIKAYRASLRQILAKVWPLLERGETALNAACEAVRLFEEDPLFNAGKGAAFAKNGKNELEASVMVSRGYRKRGVGVMRLTTVKHPVLLAKEMLIRGEADDGGGAQTHCLLSGEEAEALAEKWGLEIVDPAYFWTKLRWDEHIQGLKQHQDGAEEPDAGGNAVPGWDPHSYISQGTTGCVALDNHGTICAATSTGGMTNKVPGRVGDTPIIGAGFWAEEWGQSVPEEVSQNWMDTLPPQVGDHQLLSQHMASANKRTVKRVMGISGTGSGDTYVRLAAARTVAAMARFSRPHVSLHEAMIKMAGPGGEIQRSVGENWGRTGEGEAGMIGIESVGERSSVSIAFNTPGMFRGYISDSGKARVAIFSDDDMEELVVQS